MFKKSLIAVKGSKTNIPRIPPEAEEIIKKDFFYYIEKYPSIAAMPNIHWDIKRIKPENDPDHFYNMDYRVLKNFYKNSYINKFCSLIHHLVTDIDQNGIQSPICVHAPTKKPKFINFHPGNKRLLIAQYLNIQYFPVIYQTDKENKLFDRIKDLDQLASIYDYNCSFVYREETRALESMWLNSNYIDTHGYNDWFRVAIENLKYCQTYQGDSIIGYLLKHGLCIENEWITDIRYNGIFKTLLCKESSSPIKIKVLDKSLLDLDFWELIYHIDPCVFCKIDKSKKMYISNMFAKNNNVLENCKLLDTIKRKKYFNEEIIWEIPRR